MSQYRSGRVFALQGSAHVYGNHQTDWTGIAQGCWMVVKGANISVNIGAVSLIALSALSIHDSGTTYDAGQLVRTGGGLGYICINDTTTGILVTDSAYWMQVSGWRIELAANWAASSVSNWEYGIVQDFTDQLGLPIPQPGDVEIPALLARALNKIDDTISYGSELEGSSYTVKNASFAAANRKRYMTTASLTVTGPATPAFGDTFELLVNQGLTTVSLTDTYGTIETVLNPSQIFLAHYTQDYSKVIVAGAGVASGTYDVVPLSDLLEWTLGIYTLRAISTREIDGASLWEIYNTSTSSQLYKTREYFLRPWDSYGWEAVNGALPVPTALSGDTPAGGVWRRRIIFSHQGLFYLADDAESVTVAIGEEITYTEISSPYPALEIQI